MGATNSRLAALCGILGPAAFTGAWLAGARGQQGYSVANEHISGLAAPDAVRPQIMVAGFLGMGACTTAFAHAVEAALGGRDRAGPAPAMLRTAGVATVAAGLLRRDRMLLDPADAVTDQSWRNHGHDYASRVAYVLLVATPLVLARRFRQDPEWRPLGWGTAGTAVVAGGLLALFVSGRAKPWNGIIQRVAVTLPAGGMVAIAARILRAAGPPGT